MTRSTLWAGAGACILAATLAACHRGGQQQAAAPAAPADSATSAQPTLTPGQVQSASATSVTITTQNGGTQTFRLSPGTTIMAAHPGSVADIKAGSFIGTTNVPSPDGTGHSTEVHVFPPGVRMGDGDRPMGPPPGGAGPASRMTNGAVTSAGPAPATSMTNGSVGGVASGAQGLQIDVSFAGGHKRITVPANTPVMVMTSGTPDQLKVGTSVLVGAAPGTHDATFVNIQPAAQSR